MTCNGHVAHCMSPVTCHWTCHQSHCHLSLPPLSRVTGHQSLWSCHLSLSPVTSLSLSCQSLSLSCQSHVTVTLPATSPLSPMLHITHHLSHHLPPVTAMSLVTVTITRHCHITFHCHVSPAVTFYCHMSPVTSPAVTSPAMSLSPKVMSHHLSLVTCHFTVTSLSPVTSCHSSVTVNLSPDSYHLSLSQVNVTCHCQPVTCDSSPVTVTHHSHMSPVTVICHLSWHILQECYM